ncbi:hypothetical protein [Streptomyces sp. MBT62]|uniref:hypothetical protein n=1 Tax=Streptomyces sp. MBT62 TaxID=2800410 RepID=UPI00190C2856|nr:hypothetical protein [Streptomyces sp. MBT62]MBK3562593.1 hypothetical protein [Streptomyces sp. MBT62]
MELMRYVDNLRQELLTAAEAGDVQSRELAERLVAPLSSAVRLVLLDALSAAADEITRELAPGAVEIRLRGLDPAFVVTPPPAGYGSAGPEDDFTPSRHGAAPSAPTPPTPEYGAKEGAMARINFRPPEHLKARIEEAAGREGLSVNAWLVRMSSAMLSQEEQTGRRPERRTPQGGQSLSGWVR